MPTIHVLPTTAALLCIDRIEPLNYGALPRPALPCPTGMFGRNSRRKRRLLEQLSAVEDRIAIMSALQEWAEKQVAPPAPSGALGAGDGEGAGEGEDSARAAEAATEAGAEAALAVPPPRRVSPASSAGSPAVSTGSSAELVEMPQAEELEAAEAGEAGPGRSQLAAASEAEAGPSGGTSSSSRGGQEIGRAHV